MCEILYAAAFIVGEWIETSKDHVIRILCALLVPHQVQNLPEHIVAVYMQSVWKIVAYLVLHHDEVCWLLDVVSCWMLEVGCWMVSWQKWDQTKFRLLLDVAVCRPLEFWMLGFGFCVLLDV